MAHLTKFLQRVEGRPLPVHVTPEARLMFQSIGKHLNPISRAGIAALLNPQLTALALRLMGAKGRTFAPLFRNTVNPTIVRGGEQINVVPSEASVELDVRLLLNLSPEQLDAEVKQVAGIKDNVEYEVFSHYPGPAQPDMGLFETWCSVLQDGDPDGIPVPMLMPAATDGRLGIQTYGFCRCGFPILWISPPEYMAQMSAYRWTPSISARRLSTACCRGTDARPRQDVIWRFLFDVT